MQTTPTQIDDGGPAKKPWPINHLPSITERLKTQDNRATAEPSFCVQVKVRDVGYDANYSDSDNSVWIDMQSGEFEECDKDTPGAEQFGYKDRWETVMVAFTEAGAQDYIRQNGHNHRGELRIYTESFRRCEEMIAIRAFLMTDPAAEIAALRAEVKDLRATFKIPSWMFKLTDLPIPPCRVESGGGVVTKEVMMQWSSELVRKLAAELAALKSQVERLTGVLNSNLAFLEITRQECAVNCDHDSRFVVEILKARAALAGKEAQ